MCIISELNFNHDAFDMILSSDSGRNNHCAKFIHYAPNDEQEEERLERLLHYFIEPNVNPLFCQIFLLRINVGATLRILM